MRQPANETGSEVKKTIRKKRAKYVKMPKERKRELIFRVLMLHEEIKTACEELSFNFSTGRNLLQKYKKTGDYGYSDDLPLHRPSTIGGNSESVTGSEGKMSSCPLGLVLLSENEIKLATGKVYSPEEEQHLMMMHSHLSNYLANFSSRLYL